MAGVLANAAVAIVAAGALTTATGAQERPPPLPEQPGSGIGYPSVEAALTDLRSRPGVVISTANGWTIAIEDSSMTVWSFAPVGDPAYPAVVKRQVRASAGGGSSIETTVLCEAAKDPCDDLVRTFAAMNRAIGRAR